MENKEKNPDILLVPSITSPYFVDNRKDFLPVGLLTLVSSLRENQFVFGGPQASILHKETLERYHFVDYVIRNEADHNIILLLKNLLRKNGNFPELQDIKGLTYRNTRNMVITNQSQQVVFDLDSLPIPAYEKMQFDEYLSIDVGRGCPFNCTFCSTNQFFSKLYRVKSVTRILEEMDYCYDLFNATYFGLSPDSSKFNISDLRDNTHKVNILNDSAWFLIDTDPDRALDYAKNGLELARELDYSIGIVDSYYRMALVFRETGKYIDAMKANDGIVGLDKAIENIPDLILTDLMMPRMDGVEMCSKLKTDERTSHIPVIMLTAKAEEEDKLAGLETGADAYIIKPFSMKEIKLRVRKLIEQRNKLRDRFSREITLEPKDIVVTSIDEKFLQNAMTVIEENIDDNKLEVRKLQDEVGMSRMQLFRKLKALTGQTPSEFIRTVRLKRAAKLFEQNYGNVAQVAYETGFNNLSYFAKCFKELFKIAPSDYGKPPRK